MPGTRSVRLPTPTVPAVRAGTMYRLNKLLAPNPVYRRLAQYLERHPVAYRLFTRTEEKVKNSIFGCQMCGECALPGTGYACPMSCPKQLRNGPCGGVGTGGECEVYPAMKCVWVTAFERADAEGHRADLRLLQRPVDHRESGKSSWVNYWQGRDDGLWTSTNGLGTPVEIARPN